jgi:uncharacterized protein (TIGR03435 family)
MGRAMRHTFVVVAAVMIAVSSLHGRAQSDQNAPAFDVASIKPNVSRTGTRGHSFPGDRFGAKNVPLRDLIMIAYGEAGQPLPESQISGPSWIDVDRFDISATVGADRPNTVAQKQLMVRTLLTDRFRLAAHFESRDSIAYALVVARKAGALGAKLHHADVDCEALLATQPGRRERCILYALPSGTLMLRGQTMSAFANALTRLLDRPVVDRTDLLGGFDADADFDPQSVPGMLQLPPEDRPKDAPSLDAALQEALGLKLESMRAPVKTLVIDDVEKPTQD